MTDEEFYNKLLSEQVKVDTELSELMTNGKTDSMTINRIGELSLLSQELGAIISMYEEIEE